MGRRKLTADIQRSDSPPYQPGQKVWLSTRDIRLRLPCKKLAPRYVGPFVIQSRLTHVSLLITLLSCHSQSLHPQSLDRLQNPSPADSGGWSGLRGQNHLGFPTPLWSAGILRRSGGVSTGGEVMDSQR